MLSCWITAHFGKNPKNGGSPPRDRRFIRTSPEAGAAAVRRGIWVKWWMLRKINISMMALVKYMYVER